MLLPAALFFVLPASAQDLIADTHVIPDKGFDRVFQVATDEVSVMEASGRRRLDRFPQLANAEAVLQRARALRARTGERVELVLYEADAERNEYTRRILTPQVLVVLESGADAEAIAADLGVNTTGRLPFAPGHAIFETDETGGAFQLAATLRQARGVLSAEPLLAKQQQKKWAPNDTLYPQQWHLRNTGQGGGTSGMDVNITNTWDLYRGTNVFIAIVDDGLQITHTDLYENVNTLIDYDWNDGTPLDPSPDLNWDDHGTACAGVAAARGNNARGVSGAAPEATLVGLRLIGGSVGDAEEAAAMAHSNSIIHIKSNSWGPNDDGRTLEGPGSLTRAALSNGCTTGRGGKGVIYTWAGGNGLDANDNANYDGYANSIYTIAIAALTDGGVQSWYSEPGACLVVTAPSSGGSTDIVTTDLMGEYGYNYTGASGELADKNYTKTFGGTSSATPLAAGVIALLLQANPTLGWRDVQEILIRSATKNAAGDSDWKNNSAGFHFNHKYGAGLINTRAAIALATNNWTNLSAQISYDSTQSDLNLAIPDNSTTGVTRTFNITTNMRVEHVTVTLDVRHLSRGHLEVELTSPGGMKSRLAEKHSDTGDHYSNWKFMSVRHWGEEMQGNWTVRVADRTAGTIGTQRSVRLDFYGTSASVASNQPPTLTTIGNKSVIVSNLLAFTVTAADSVDGDPVRLWATNVPSWATFATVTNAGGVTNTFSGTPTNTGTFNVYFFAGDKDGTNTETVAITVTDPSSTLDISGYQVKQYDSTQTYTIPDGTLVSPGGYVIIARNVSEVEFEAFWGVTLGANVVFLNSGETVPQINGDETYELRDALNNLVEGPTAVALAAGNSVQRTNTTASATATASWRSVAQSSATPGSGAVGNGSAGLVINEYSDASGTGNYINEFVELYYDAGGGGSPPETPPVLNPIGDTSVQVSNLLQFAVTATPTDGDAVTLSVSNAPAGAVFSATNENGTFYFTPDASQVGVHTTSFYAVDNDGVSLETIRITVNPGANEDATNVLAYFDFQTDANVFESVPQLLGSGISGASVTTRDGTYTNFGGNPSSGRAIADSGWTGSEHYFEFTVTVSDGYTMRVDALSFDDQRSGTGPTDWRLRYSGDGYASDLGAGITHTSFATNRIALFLDGLTGSVTFRIHGDNASAAGGTWRMDNLFLYGAATLQGGGDDTDSDGLPDDWEMLNFGLLTNEASGDFDEDGFSNLEEFIAVTEPTNALSYFQIDSIAFDGSSRVAFQSYTGRTYSVLYATNLINASWEDLGSGVQGTNGLMTITDPDDAEHRMYRLKVTRP